MLVHVTHKQISVDGPDTHDPRTVEVIPGGLMQVRQASALESSGRCVRVRGQPSLGPVGLFVRDVQPRGVLEAATREILVDHSITRRLRCHVNRPVLDGNAVLGEGRGARCRGWRGIEILGFRDWTFPWFRWPSWSGVSGAWGRAHGCLGRRRVTTDEQATQMRYGRETGERDTEIDFGASPDVRRNEPRSIRGHGLPAENRADHCACCREQTETAQGAECELAGQGDMDMLKGCKRRECEHEVCDSTYSTVCQSYPMDSIRAEASSAFPPAPHHMYWDALEYPQEDQGEIGEQDDADQAPKQSVKLW